MHKSVLLEECITGLNIKPDGIYVNGFLLRGNIDTCFKESNSYINKKIRPHEKNQLRSWAQHCTQS